MLVTKRKATILYHTARAHGPLTAARVTANELRNRYLGPHTRPNPGLPCQRTLIHDAIDGGADTWIIWFDGGRLDWFRRLAPQYFDIGADDVDAVWNGGVGYTGDWTLRHLRGDYPEMGLFSMAQLRQFDSVDYDGRDHFEVAPHMDMPDGSTMQERLAALGYREKAGGSDDDAAEIEPRETNKVVREHMGDLRGGVVRYLKPHPPFEGLERMTSGSSKLKDTIAALADGSLSFDELERAYSHTYRLAFEAAADLVPELDGRIILTSDHGECLRCGQLFHSRRHRKHDHLCVVPWAVVRE